MDEDPSDQTPRRYDETTDPRNPPNSMLDPNTRRAAVWSYFVPVVVLFIVVGVGLLYFSNRPPHSESAAANRSEVGTVGRTEGGFDPQPGINSTRDEVRLRGDDLTPITSISELDDVDSRTMNGRRVSLADVPVDSVAEQTFWLRHDDARFKVIEPAGATTVKAGMRVSVTGRIEADSNGSPLIRADRIQVQ